MESEQGGTHPIDSRSELSGMAAGIQVADRDGDIWLRREELQAGLFIAGPTPERRTELLTQHLIQVAAAGDGFCYVHPIFSNALDFVQKLPEERLKDLIWIDLDRKSLCRVTDAEIPPQERIRVDPLVSSERSRLDRLRTPQAEARVVDFLDIVAHDDRVDWKVMGVLEPLVESSIENNWSIPKLANELESAFGADCHPNKSVERILEETFDSRVAEAIDSAEARDPRSLERLKDFLHDMTTWPADRVFGGEEPSISFPDAVANDAIIVVAGTGIMHDSQTRTNSGVEQSTQLLASAVVRRLWEALQTERTTQPMFPIAIDQFPKLFPTESNLLRELIRTSASDRSGSRAAPWLTGPGPAKLEWQTQHLLGQDIGAWVLVDVEEQPSIYRSITWLGNHAAFDEEAAKEWASQSSPQIDCIAISDTGERVFNSYPPYPCKRDEAAAGEAISNSVRMHSCSTARQESVRFES